MGFAMPVLWGSTLAFATALGLLTPRAEGAPAAPTTPPSPAFDAAATVADAAHKLASERTGVVALHRHIAAQQHGPGHDGTLDEQSGVLREENAVVAVRIYKQVSNGPAGGNLAKAQAGADKYLPDDEYQLPLREDRLADYTFETAACDGCAAGNVAVRFTSLKRDETHGDGLAVIDTAAHHFVRIDFVPSVLPKYVDKASISIVFGRALRDLWDVFEMDQHYSGHMLFISGGADITTSLGNYRRFKSRGDGLRALDSGV
jgi:hypothetical protein